MMNSFRLNIFHFVLFFCFDELKLNSQIHYIKIIDFDSLGQSCQQVISYDNHFLLGFDQTCTSNLQSQCSGILKMDDNGKILDKILIEKFSNNFNSIVISDNKLCLTGEKEYSDVKEGNSYVVHEIDYLKLDSIKEYKIFDRQKPFVNMFQTASTIWNGKMVITGSGSLGANTGNRCLIFALNKDFSIDTLMYFDYIKGNLIPFELFVDSNNNLSIYIQENDWDIKKRYSSIMKFDTNYNLVWRWKSPEQRLAIAYPHGLESDDGDMILTLDDVTFSSINRIYKIRRDSTVKWIANWPGDNGNQARYIDRLKKAKNGDIIGVGRHSEFLPNLRLERVPFIFRLDPNGNFKWIKVFYKDQKYSNGYLVQGGFSDVVEADNGDLIAVGRIHNVLAYDPRVFGPRNDWDIIVARLGPDGCIEPGCPDINKIDDLIVDTEEVNINEDVKIYPNPFHTHFTVASTEKIDHITVYNTTGQIVSRSIGNNDIDLSTASNGLYFVELMIGSRRILKKVIKQ